MDRDHRHTADSVLRMLLEGATFVGAHWYGTFIAVLARTSSSADGRPYDVNYSELYLSIESGFALFAVRPVVLPDRIEAEPDVPLPEKAATIARLANDPIGDVALGEHYPHLIFTLDSGQVLFLDGSDAEFESWIVQTAGCSGGDWTIFATPNHDVAVIDPANAMSLEDIDAGSAHDVLNALVTSVRRYSRRTPSESEAE